MWEEAETHFVKVRVELLSIPSFFFFNVFRDCTFRIRIAHCNSFYWVMNQSQC
ncbi:hypothetical protein ACS0TY_001118 [Phlomoides rotata]